MNNHAREKGYINQEQYNLFKELIKKTDDNKPEYLKNSYIAADIKRLLVLYLQQTVFGDPSTARYEHYLDIDIAETMDKFNCKELQTAIAPLDQSKILTATPRNDTLLTSSAKKQDVLSNIEKILKRYVMQFNLAHNMSCAIPVSNNKDDKVKLEEDRQKAIDYEMFARDKQERCDESEKLTQLFNIRK